MGRSEARPHAAVGTKPFGGKNLLPEKEELP